jgi:predicted esterase
LNLNQHLLQEGSVPFHRPVSYKIFGKQQLKRKKPLLVYLHGFGDNMDSFAETCSDIIGAVDAYHLFLQGPYLIYDRKREKQLSEWGHYWYHYDGNQDTFLRSLEHTSAFIANSLDRIKSDLAISRICLIGFSMGGYMAGAFSFSYMKYVNELIVAGCRLKSEILPNKIEAFRHLSVLAMHGLHDNVVDYKPQQREIEELSSFGIDSHFQLFEEKHIFSCNMREMICNWLSIKGYQVDS